MFLASRGRQCLIGFSVWKIGLVSRIFEEGMGEIKTKVGLDLLLKHLEWRLERKTTPGTPRFVPPCPKYLTSHCAMCSSEDPGSDCP